MTVRDVTDESFDAEVLAAGAPVVVDFWAPWCRPCEAAERTLRELAEEHAGRLELVRVNVDENPVVAARYGVLALPTVILFHDGEPHDPVAGARRRSHYERLWARWL